MASLYKEYIGRIVRVISNSSRIYTGLVSSADEGVMQLRPYLLVLDDSISFEAKIQNRPVIITLPVSSVENVGDEIKDLERIAKEVSLRGLFEGREKVRALLEKKVLKEEEIPERYKSQ